MDINDSINKFKNGLRDLVQDITLAVEGAGQSTSETMKIKASITKEIEELQSRRKALAAENAVLSATKDSLQKGIAEMRAILSGVRL